jgi:hypothetical protein
MKPEDLLPYSRKPAIGPYPEPYDQVHTITHYSFKINLNIILPFRLGTPKSSS